MTILELDNVTVQYSTENGALTAVSDASLSVERGEFLGIAGESGSGKSTLAKSIIGGLDQNGFVESGVIKYKDKEIQNYSEEEYNNNLRWKEIAWIPQGSMNSLDPLQRVSEQAIEIAKQHTDLSKEEILEKFSTAFETVGLPASRINDYPHQFSGGMQQRAIIALGLFLRPNLLIADEPTTALDVIMQDQIMKHIEDIREEYDTTVILITHDISVMFETCDRVAIMHSGQIAEKGSVQELYHNPHHPYTILFKGAFPDIREPDRDLEIIEGHPPQVFDEPNYCTFVDRCPWGVEECKSIAPPMETVDDDSHQVACIRHEEIANENKEVTSLEEHQ